MAFKDSSHEVIYQSSHCNDIDDNDDDCEKLKLIEALKRWQSELKVGDPKITKIDNIIIRLERRYLNSNRIESGS